MKIEIAKALMTGFQAAIEQAEAEGREELNTGDIAAFAALDDAARIELEAAIQAAER